MTFQKSKFLRYIVSYKEAGDRIVESISENRAYENELTLPICHLYCHYLELGLKHLILLGNQLLTKPIDWPKVASKRAGFPSDTHNLKYLQDKCIEILTQLKIEATTLVIPDIHFDVLDTCIHKFLDAANPDIESAILGYRYPVNKEGEQILPDRYCANVNDLREVISRVETLFFDQAEIAIDDIFSNKKPGNS